MRLLLVGILVLITSGAAMAQVSGQVDSVGFQRHYRPNCWTPMVVSLRPETPDDATYQIQIVQEDFDGDRVTYTTPVTVTGNRDGQARDIKKEVYFIPKARLEPGFRYGLPLPNDGIRHLNNQLRVYVATRTGKQITQLPIPDTIVNIDPPMSAQSAIRGARLILAVSDPTTGSRPIFGFEPTFDPADGDLEHSPVRGNLEDAVVIHVRPRELPESVLAYEAVDAVVFCNADPSELEQPTPERMRALREYVRQGGKLVICQPPGWEKTLAFGDLLPVSFPAIGQGERRVQGVLDRQDNTALTTLVQEGVPFRNAPAAIFGRPGQDSQRQDAQRRWAAQEALRLAEAWRRARGPFKVAVAQAKPGTFVTHWIEWPTDEGEPLKTPYIARRAYGLGAVTWVAQDLGDPGLTRVKQGWPQVWSAVFDWNDHPFVPDPNKKPIEQPLVDTYDRATGVDLGHPLPAGMEHGQRGAGLVFLVVFFFIAYWAAAGPVSYLLLAGRKRTTMSWFAFAVVAVAATLVTAGVVELVLRTDPEVRHFSVVRLNPGGPAVARSGIGLYIADDGGQRIELRDAAMDKVSYITPFPVHPAQVSDQPAFTTVLDYEIPVPAPKSKPDEDPSVVIPYRTTLKKLQAHWVGEYKGSLSGRLRLSEGQLQGVISNHLPHDLRDVYLCYVDANGIDQLLYLPAWKQGETIDLQKVQWHGLGSSGGLLALPRQNKAIRAALEPQSGVHDLWTGYFFNRLRGAGVRLDDGNHQFTLPILSFFERFSPMQSTPENTGRVDLLRRGARHLDLSQLVAAGDLAIAAIADGTPLPMPFYVQGEAVPGEGVTFFQASLPIERPAPEPATQPVDVK